MTQVIIQSHGVGTLNGESDFAGEASNMRLQRPQTLTNARRASASYAQWNLKRANTHCTVTSYVSSRNKFTFILIHFS